MRENTKRELFESAPIPAAPALRRVEGESVLSIPRRVERIAPDSMRSLFSVAFRRR